MYFCNGIDLVICVSFYFLCTALLERLSTLLINAKDRRVFFINNYDMVNGSLAVLF